MEGADSLYAQNDLKLLISFSKLSLQKQRESYRKAMVVSY